MNDVLLEILRAVLVFFLFTYLVFSSAKAGIRTNMGWKLIILGFGLLFFASLIDITDNFESLNKYVVVGDTTAQAFLEKVVGYLGGFLLLTLGFWKWLPIVHKLKQTQEQLEASKKQLTESNAMLEKKVAERTKELSESQKSLVAKNKELKKINKFMLGRELKIRELKDENEKLEEEFDSGESS